MRALSIAVAAALALLCGTSARSQPCGAWVSAVAQDLPNSTIWSYSVTNTSENERFTLWFVGIEVDEGVGILEALAPAGWYADISQPSFIAWMCISTEVPSGGSVHGFGARFTSAPTTQKWAAQFTNLETGETVPLYGIVATPEPAGLVALLCGLATTGAYLKRKRA